MKKVKTLDIAKASQQPDIPIKTSKQSSDFFAEYFYENINQYISQNQDSHPSDLKLSDVNPVYKKKSKTPKITMEQLAYYLTFPIFTEDASTIKFSSFSILYYPNINNGFVEATKHNTA